MSTGAVTIDCPCCEVEIRVSFTDAVSDGRLWSWGLERLAQDAEPAEEVIRKSRGRELDRCDVTPTR